MSTVWHGDHLLRTLFLRSIVLQTDSHTKGIDDPTFRVDSPTKPVIAVFSPTNHWSYSSVRLWRWGWGGGRA